MYTWSIYIHIGNILYISSSTNPTVISVLKMNQDCVADADTFVSSCQFINLLCIPPILCFRLCDPAYRVSYGHATHFVDSRLFSRLESMENVRVGSMWPVSEQVFGVAVK